MAQGVFSISGLISGLDTSSIIQKLVAADSGVLKQYQAQKTATDNALTAWQGINTDIADVNSKANSLATVTNWETATATSSDTSLLTATSSGSASPGTYQITVKSLAQGEQDISQGYADSTTATVGTGTITLSLGGTAYSPITINSSNDTLTGVAAAINAAGLPIVASVINDGSGSNAYHLVLQSTKGGASNTISVSNTLSGGTAPTFSVLQKATSSSISVGDPATAVTITETSNTLTDVIPGVTLNLVKADTTTPITLTVAPDTTSMKKMITDFIASYNTMADAFNTATAYNATTQVAGPLQSDVVAGVVQGQFNSLVTGDFTVSGSTIKNLESLGITMDANGHLNLTDSSALDNALSTNLTGVKNFFTDTTNGFGFGVTNFVTQLQDPVNGAVTLQLQYYNNLDTEQGQAITDEQTYLNQEQQDLQNQFNQMETALATLQQQQQQFDASLGLAYTASTSSSSTSKSSTSTSS